MENSKKIIIGLGSGRCGTVSLARLLDYQQDSSVSHETDKYGYTLLPWDYDEQRFKRHIGLLLSNKQKFIGDVASYNLPYWKKYLNLGYEVKFVLLKRDKDKTISSFQKKTKNNPWMLHDGSKWVIDKHWDMMHPKMQASSKIDALDKYYDLYYSLAREIPKKLVFELKTEELNNEQKCISMLKFCGFGEIKYKRFHKNAL